MPKLIDVRHLKKTFKIPTTCSEPRLWARFKHFVVHPSEKFTAVDDLSFSVEEGEIVGFLGANGSGKSTTIKMLTGILTPSAGEIDVAGYVPHRQRMAYTAEIGVVLGQKSLLWWNIPVIESFKLYRDIYSVPRDEFEQRVQRFAELLELTDYLHVPVRKLSLGLRMRAEIIASLLHRPKVVYLDEPAIGLDVLARLNLKRFLRRINEEMGVTIFLTTHNMFDVEDLCRHCVILSKGQTIFDGDISQLKSKQEHKILELQLLEVVDQERFDQVLGNAQILEQSQTRYKLEVASDRVLEIIGELLASCRMENLNVVPPTLESIVEEMFEECSSRGKNA